jgi:diaminopimelate epimerase
MKPIPFAKMSGSGNDFIVIDNRDGNLPDIDPARFARQVCCRRMSAGADGLILVERSDRVDFKWRFFNSDGSVAEMCGNGARCVARFAKRNGIAAAGMAFETLAGTIHAQVIDERVKIKMTDPCEPVPMAELAMGSQTLAYGSVNTGVPHVVLTVADIEAADVKATGRRIREHPHFAPAGTNVNFMALQDNGVWAVRTYERGVEDETLACGTGIVAAALVLAMRQEIDAPVSLRSRSGSLLKVYFSKAGASFHEVYLEGDARLIYEGQLMPDAWQYTPPQGA